jgi:hypothetical protein
VTTVPSSISTRRRSLAASSARALPAYRLWVRFSDGTEGEVELARLVFSDARPIVTELRDPAAFARVRVESDTVTWDNGFDLAPEFLYEHKHPAVAPARA